MTNSESAARGAFFMPMPRATPTGLEATHALLVGPTRQPLSAPDRVQGNDPGGSSQI